MKNIVKQYSFDSINHKSYKRIIGLRNKINKRYNNIDDSIQLMLKFIENNGTKDLSILTHFLEIKKMLYIEIQKCNYILFYKNFYTIHKELPRDINAIKIDYDLIFKSSNNINLDYFKNTNKFNFNE
jgi:hypothetical protein